MCTLWVLSSIPLSDMCTSSQSLIFLYAKFTPFQMQTLRFKELAMINILIHGREGSKG